MAVNKKRDLLTKETLMEFLHYDADCGSFTWIKRSGGKCPGDSAGFATTNGYTSIGLLTHVYSAHRLAWLYAYGEWPKFVIDHINGNPRDNRISNLRDVRQQVNLQNQSKPISSNKTSNLLGVCFNKKAKKWQAAIGINGQIKYLGVHKTPELAHAAYVKAKRELHEGCRI